MDAQGPDLPRRYARAAGATFPVLVDIEGLLAALYGFQAIPNGWVIDPNGVIRFEQVGGFDIRRTATAAAVEQILQGAVPELPVSTSPGPTRAGLEAFQEGVRLWHRGRKRAAVDAWLLAAEADPANLLVRKQIWYVLHPDRFAPDVDFAWQRAQLKREKLVGIRSANPLPDDLP
jgi:hypothetical protein